MVQSMRDVFPLSLFERRIWAESREIIKQKLERRGADALRMRVGSGKS
jgi:hypothetical protein